MACAWSLAMFHCGLPIHIPESYIRHCGRFEWLASDSSGPTQVAPRSRTRLPQSVVLQTTPFLARSVRQESDYCHTSPLAVVTH